MKETVEKKSLAALARKEKRNNILKNIGITVFNLALAVLIAELLYYYNVGPQAIIIVYTLALFIIAAVTDGYAYGLVATLVGVFIYDLLVSEPRLKFSITIGFPVTLCIMLLVTVTTSTITTRIRSKAKIATQKEQRAELLYAINRQLLSSRDIASIATHAITYLENNMHRSIAFYPAPVQNEKNGLFFRQGLEDIDSVVFSSKEELEAAKLAFKRKEPVGCGTINASKCKCYYWPIKSQGQVLGVFAISCDKGVLSESEHAFLQLISEQSAQALQVQVYSAKQQEAQVMIETEKARNSFLRAISHDLRTPLTSIIGASSVLVENSEVLDAEKRKELTCGIYEDSEWLLSMVENLLSVTRIHNENMAVIKTVEAAEEVVAGAVGAVRKRFSAAKIAVSVPEELLLVPMDGILISQVLTNLMDNALRHSGKNVLHVEVGVSKTKDGWATFYVADDGPGIPANMLPRLFEVRSSNSPRSEDSSRGLGMGLSICKTIVEAHGGYISGGNRAGGGAEFVFNLPLEEEDIE